MGEHAEFSPSGLPRNRICPASVKYQKDREVTEDMAIGTVLHKLSEKSLVERGKYFPFEIGDELEADGFKVTITEELSEVIKYYFSAVVELEATYPDADMYVEQRVDLSAYGVEYSNVFGTADVILKEIFGTLIVIDLKTGVGHSVPADAEQLKMYAVMAAGDALLSYEKIITVVIQPRDKYGDKIKMAEHKPEDLDVWMREEVIPAIDDSRSENPTFQASEEGCRWCGFKGKCKAQAEFAMQIASKDFELVESIDQLFDEMYISSPDELSNDVVSKILDMTKFFEDWLKSVRSVALGRSLEGQDIPNYKIVESIKHKTWDPDKDIEHILRKELKLRKKDIFEEKLLSPNAILELVKKDEKLIKRITELIIKPQGYPTLAKLSDRRSVMETETFSAEEDFACV